MTGHPIVHVEIPASDLKEASKFYTEVFGWQIDTSTMEEYPMFAAEGGPGGGFVKLGDMAHSVGRPLLFIGTDDIDASLAAVEAHGGKTVMARTANVIGQTQVASLILNPAGYHNNVMQTLTLKAA